MNTPWQILVASSDLESRRALLQLLSRLGLDPISASNVSQARETLQRDKVGLVFCERHLADGSYRDILNMARSSQETIRVVVTSKHADWDEYLEAIGLGAFDVITSPCRATDVEWMVIQAKRDNRTQSEAVLSAGRDQTPLARASAAGTA
jgi:DNA-binding NtrC family response regulator